MTNALNKDNVFSTGLRSLGEDIDKEVMKGNSDFVSVLLEECCKNDFCIVAVDVENGQVVGAILGLDH